jgi:outer membrane protein TolC
MQTALQNRPDISKAIKEMKATSVRLDMAKKDVLPKLDLILSTYVAGLEGDSEVGKAFGNQFDQGEPGYSVGLLFEVPLGNRAARARSCRRQFEVQKALHGFHATVEAGMTDVELAVREVETSYREMLSKFQSMVATEQESLYLLDRWKVLPGDDRSTSFLLEELLDAQERVADEEEGFVNAQVGYALAFINLKRATGTLLQFVDGVSPAPTFPEEPAAPEVDSSRNLPPLPAPAAADS